MAKFGGVTAIFAVLAVSALAIQHATGELICENLSADICSFAIASSGKRCVLEKYAKGANLKLQCRTSQVKVDGMAEWIESDECIQACGVERSWTGISSDSLLDLHFLDRLCSIPCFDVCHNIVDLYFNLAAAEGVYLPKFCESFAQGARRVMDKRILADFVSYSSATGEATAPAPSSISSPEF